MSPTPLTQDQQAILLELEAILATVKDINFNLTRSVQLLNERSPNTNFNEVIRQNIHTFRQIISALESV